MSTKLVRVSGSIIARLASLTIGVLVITASHLHEGRRYIRFATDDTARRRGPTSERFRFKRSR